MENVMQNEKNLHYISMFFITFHWLHYICKATKNQIRNIEKTKENKIEAKQQWYVMIYYVQQLFY